MTAAIGHVAEAGKALVFFNGIPRRGLDRPWPLRELTSPLDLDGAVDLAWEWLDRADYGEDEHDGLAEPGWHVFNGPFGLVDQVPGAFIAVEPTYIYLPK